MVETSDPYEKETAQHIAFWVDVDANATKVINMIYRIDRGIDVDVNHKG